MRSLSMLFLAERVYRTILRYRLLPPGARVMVALSGGADSTALACLLVELVSRAEFRVEGAAHFNHGLRGAASDEDEAFCRELAARLGLGWRSGTADTRAAAAAAGTSLEDASRRLRYAFLLRAASELGASHVAVGHTRDDQAETVLLQMLRGAGPRGRGAMSHERRLELKGSSGSDIRLVRPLLDISHAELIGWLRYRGQAFREDASNRDPRFLRNRVRHELIPFIEARIAPSASQVLARDAQIAAADADLLDGLAAAAYSRLVLEEGERVVVDREALVNEPLSIQRRVALRALGNLRGARFVGFNQVDRVLGLADNRLRGPIALPGARVSVAGNRLVVEGTTRDAGRKVAAGMNFLRRALSIPGEARLPGTGWVVSCLLRRWDASAGELPLSGTAEAIVDASRVSGLAVRTRRPGDWFRPLNLGGRKKLQDYFVDRKVPRHERDKVPLVVDARDRIVWVAGHGIDEEFRVSGATRDVVILKLRGERA